MKIGIVTFHRAHNCGAALQCAALVKVLRRLGHDVKAVDCNDVGESHRFYLGNVSTLRAFIGWLVHFIFSIGVADSYFWHYRRFRRKFMPYTMKFAGVHEATYIDRFIVGSDQVFNPEITRNMTGEFLLEHIADASRKCTYAASFGSATLPMEYRKRFAKALDGFSHLSFRETSANVICRSELGLKKEVVTVLDPTLLLEAEDYVEMEYPSKIKGRFIVVYWAGHCGEEARKVAGEMAIRHSLEVVFIIQNRLSLFRKGKGEWIAMSPDRFLWLMRNAEYIISTSFHGTAFSIINRKPFIVLRPVGYNLNERIVDLLERLGIPEQVVYDNAVPEGDELEARFNVDYFNVESRLDVLRKESMDYLKMIVS